RVEDLAVGGQKEVVGGKRGGQLVEHDGLDQHAAKRGPFRVQVVRRNTGKVGTGEGIGHLPRVARGSDTVLEGRSAGARLRDLVGRSRRGGGDAATCLHEAAARESPRSGG